MAKCVPLDTDLGISLTFAQCINSIDRALLNQFLLNQAEALDNISILFQTKVQTIDFDKRTMFIFDNTSKGSRSVNFDFCVGADGSYSIVRRQMMKVVRYVNWKPKDAHFS